MSTLKIELDDALLALVEERAAVLGKPSSEVIADALRRQLGGGRLRDILDSARTRAPLPEDEAMQLAITELRAVRAGRETRDTVQVVRSSRRVVIDPNVLVSGAISSGGASTEVIDLIDAALIVPIVSPALLAELSEVLGRERFRRYLDLESAMAYVAELERLGEALDDPADVPRVTRDPTDDYLIALARAAEVDTIVSGDLDLASLELPDLAVLSPRGLLEAVATGGQDERSGRS